MTNPLTDISQKEHYLAAGLMSGTSMDGIDVALVSLPADGASPEVELIAFETTPYPDELRTSLMDAAFGQEMRAEDIACLHTSIAVSFANAFLSVCRKAGVDTAAVDFIGSHGQTIAHAPPADDGTSLISGTLQLGPPAMIAALAGVTTVGDFRTADMALGGQGAPLAPYVDYRLRKSASATRVILNIGGIANLTYMPAACGPDEVVAFDTGPGNMVIDALYRALFPDASGYDTLNEQLASGRADASLVETFLGHPYMTRKPPKSAGHREFGAPFAWEFLSRAQAAGMKRANIFASAVSLTTRSIHDAIERFVLPAGNMDEFYVTGGGLRNDAMMEELRSFLAPVSVRPIDELGIPAEAKEAVDFAVLARETLLGRENVLPRVTGASRGTVLGTIAWGGGV